MLRSEGECEKSTSNEDAPVHASGGLPCSLSLLGGENKTHALMLRNSLSLFLFLSPLFILLLLPPRPFDVSLLVRILHGPFTFSAAPTRARGGAHVSGNTGERL